MAKFSISNLKSTPQSAGHKRNRPLSSVARLPSLSTLVISEDNSNSSKGRIVLTPRKSEFRKGWGSFKSRQRYSSLVTLDGNSTADSSVPDSKSLFSASSHDVASTPFPGGSGSQLSLCSSISSTPSTPLKIMSENSNDITVSLDAWGFFADI